MKTKMNKQEAIEEIKNLEGLTILDKTINFDSKMIPKKEVLDIVNQLEEPTKPPEQKPLEPEKPVVPQFVADWYEENKDYFENKLFVYIRNFNIYNSWNESKNFNLWFDDNEDSIQTLVNMHQFGYEVEKEKLYTVEIPSHGTPDHIVLRKHLDGEICIDHYLSDEWRDYKCAQLT